MKLKINIILLGLAIAGILMGVTKITTAKAKSNKDVELGGTEVVSALIVGIDNKDRTLTLIGRDGNVSHFEVGETVRNFDQIEVGDHVNIEFYASVALHLGEQGSQPKDDAGLIMARAPKGEKPAGIAVEVVDVSAMIQSIDKENRSVTLKGHDGQTNIVKVDESIDQFDSLKVGDMIHARFTEAVAVSVEKGSPDDSAFDASKVSLLFVQNAQNVYYDEDLGLLVLEDINPSVTFFSDRPYRIAGHVLVPGFIKLWDEGEDSFKDDPPNANLSILKDGQVKSAVVEIADPQLKNDRLTYKVVKVLDGELPTSGGVCSLFIDGLFDFEGGAFGSGVRGAAGGALIGAISGNAGRGAAIGAGVGIIGGAMREGRERDAAAAQAQYSANVQSRTRVIYVPNSNGSSTPVTMILMPNGWQGPRGEIYQTLPNVEQLRGMYGN
jgi:hypothetical protein